MTLAHQQPHIFNLCYDVAYHIVKYMNVKDTIAFYIALHRNAYTDNKLINREYNGCLLATYERLIKYYSEYELAEYAVTELLSFAAHLSAKDNACFSEVIIMDNLFDDCPNKTFPILMKDYQRLLKLDGRRIRGFTPYVFNVKENKYISLPAIGTAIRNNPEAVAYLTGLWQSTVLKNPQEHLFEFYRSLFDLAPLLKNRKPPRSPWNVTPDCVNDPVKLFMETCAKISDLAVLFNVTWQIYRHNARWIKKYLSDVKVEAGKSLIELLWMKTDLIKKMLLELFELLYCRVDRNADVLFGKLFDANPEPKNVEYFNYLREIRVVIAARLN